MRWLPNLKSCRAVTHLCLILFWRLFRLTFLPLPTICTGNSRMLCIKVWIQITLFVTLARNTAAVWPSHSATTVKTIGAVWWRCIFQVRIIPMVRKKRLLCTTSMAESCWKQLIYGQARWPLWTPLCRNVIRGRWRVVGFRITAYVIRVSRAGQAYFSGPVNKYEEDSDNINRNCATRPTLTGTIQNLLSYAQMSAEDYGVRPVDVGIANILKDIISSTGFSVNPRVTYICYVSISKMMIVHQSVLSLFWSWAKTHQLEKLLISRSSMPWGSTYLLRKSFGSWFVLQMC